MSLFSPWDHFFVNLTRLWKNKSGVARNYPIILLRGMYLAVFQNTYGTPPERISPRAACNG
ncbi:MAG: hypothetical protein KKE17_09660 [Proteobacteria bacterium]|nr:hypothetical protein [Pseudomonadota bacterium]MBU1710257.1 hypothetical protein [Pseudomonadota bacterium]